MMNPVEDFTNYKLGIFYFNRNDPRTIVPKRVAATGFQINFARLLSALIVFALCSLIVVLLQRMFP